MATRGRRLGRGLDSLLPGAEGGALREVGIDRIEPNPHQPRQRMDRKALEDLAASIKEHGVVQPLVVAAAGDDRYRLIVGERRWQAARLAGVERVPVVIKEASDRQTLELALIENVQRQDLNPLEEAAAYQRLIQDFGLTQQEVGQQVGKSRVTIANTLRLLSLPAALQQTVLEGALTEGHARALLTLPDVDLQMRVMQRVVRDELSVRRTEELVRRLLAGPAGRKASERAPDVAAAEDDLRRALGTKVTLQQRKRGGRIVIEYFSDEEFAGLYERLTGAE